MTGYEKIEQKLKLDSIGYVDDIVVTIKVGQDVRTELLMCGIPEKKWEWLNDWWEGEPDVELVGAQYLSRISVFGNKLFYA